jgi:demethylmenaquinone methyltransferase/2-methoxy-6-polyprenyl-1,4-benzoquinol methylase
MMAGAGGILPPTQEKAVWVQAMFGRIARHYDLMNHLMTFGRDRAWRRYTVAQLAFGAPSGREGQGSHRRMGQSRDWEERRWGDGTSRILDVASGTGDLALEALRQVPQGWVVGVDFVPQMLDLARSKSRSVAGQLSLAAGDALRLPFEDGTFDGVVTGFALRNVTDIGAAFGEMARVTRPGGRMACLEISRPRLPVFRQVFHWYFYRLVPLVGGWISGQRAAYTYLPHSLTGFASPEEIAELMRSHGWRGVHYRRLMLGTVAVHVGTRGQAFAKRAEE